MVVAHTSAPQENVIPLQQAGVEVLQFSCSASELENQPDLRECMQELARREMTNILVEGGGSLLGSCFDQRLIDEVHIFIAPKIIGGAEAVTPLAGKGLEMIPERHNIREYRVQQLDSDIYINGQLEYPA